MFIVGLLMKFGLGERAAKGVALLLAVIAVLGLLWWLRNDAYKDGVNHEHARAAAALAKANHDFLEQKARADDLAARQRLTDTIAVTQRERELRDAIASTPDTAPDAVRIRLGCERLRRAAGSAHTANLPAVCRSGG